MGQARGLGRRADGLVKVQGVGNGEEGGEIGGAGVDPAAHVLGAVLLAAHERLDVGDARLADIGDADADGGADPFVAVQAHEIRAQGPQVEGDLAPGMGAVEDHVHIATPGQGDDLGHRQDQTVPVADLGEQHQADAGMGGERRVVGVDQPLMGGGGRQVEGDDVDAAPGPQPAHGPLQAVIVVVGIEHGVAGAQAGIAADQGLQGLGGAPGEGDLVGRHPQVGGDPGPGGLHIGVEFPARIEGIAAIDHGGVAVIGLQHRPGHHPEIAVLQLDCLGGDVELGGDGGPVDGLGGPGGGGPGPSRRGGRQAGPHQAATGQSGHESPPEQFGDRLSIPRFRAGRRCSENRGMDNLSPN